MLLLWLEMHFGGWGCLGHHKPSSFKFAFSREVHGNYRGTGSNICLQICMMQEGIVVAIKSMLLDLLTLAFLTWMELETHTE